MSSDSEWAKPRGFRHPVNRKKIRKPRNQASKREQMRKRINRRRERYGGWGREREEHVSLVLEKMVEKGLIHSFAYSTPNSKDDQEGKDFTVVRIIEGATQERSFGISISLQSKNLSTLRYSEIPQWQIPINMKEETIERKILSLFI